MTTATATSATNELERIRALALELPTHDRSSRDELLAYQRYRLRALVRHAAAKSPYYRDLLGADAGSRDVDLEKLPTLPKATLVAEFDRIVTDPRLRLADLEAHIARAEAGAHFLDRYDVFTTSGTTGLRGVVVYDREEFEVWIAACLRALARLGVTGDTRLAAIGAPSPVHITRQLFAAFTGGRRGAPRLTVATPVEEIVAALNDYQPEAITTYASIGGLLAEEQLQGRLRMAPRMISSDRRRSRRTLSAGSATPGASNPFNVYATTEAPYVALSSSDRVGLHVREELVIVEAVDEDNRRVPPGTPSYKVLLTNLVNRAQPLIRYELSDSVTMADGPDPSGRPYLRIACVDGRSDDILQFAGRGGEVAVHPYRLRAPLAPLADVLRYQVVHQEEGLRIRVVLRPSAPRDTPAAVRRALTRALEEAGAIPPPIEVEPVAEIARERGHGAKLKLVVSAHGG